MRKLLLFAFIITLVTACTTQKTPEQPYLIILSMDGFRWDYTDSVETPHFDRIEKMGIKAESMQASFPTKTFPNHYTIATGLYPNHHGIVNNTFYAPEFDEVYAIRKREAVQNGKFYGGEPIWNTAEKQGMKAGSFFWVGSEANIQNMHPSYWKIYDGSFDYHQRVDSVISWLSLEEDKRPHFISWYVSEPDGVGHNFGPKSPEADSVIQALDGLLGYFMEQLEQHPLGKQVNVIVTSDHGMGSISEERSILLKDHLKDEWIQYALGGNPVYNILAEENCIDSVYNALKDLDGVTIFKNSEAPEALNYGSHERCLDLTLVADSAWSIYYKSPHYGFGGGTHGYDNANKDMNAIFYAYGPAFKKHYKQAEFKNVSVYPLMCEVLKLTPAPNDGDLEEVKGMLK